MSKIIAYTFNAAEHCPRCAEAANMTRDGAVDSEGNEVGVVWDINDCPDDLVCDTCGDTIRDGTSPASWLRREDDPSAAQFSLALGLWVWCVNHHLGQWSAGYRCLSALTEGGLFTPARNQSTDPATAFDEDIDADATYSNLVSGDWSCEDVLTAIQIDTDEESE